MQVLGVTSDEFSDNASSSSTLSDDDLTCYECTSYNYYCYTPYMLREFVLLREKWSCIFDSKYYETLYYLDSHVRHFFRSITPALYEGYNTFEERNLMITLLLTWSHKDAPFATAAGSDNITNGEALEALYEYIRSLNLPLSSSTTKLEPTNESLAPLDRNAKPKVKYL